MTFYDRTQVEEGFPHRDIAQCGMSEAQLLEEEQ